MIAVLDCGTTNTKCYVVARSGTLLAEGYSPFGVKDNALKKDREDYKQELCTIVRETCSKVKDGDALEQVVAFGMISSDLGIEIVPHLTAPVGLADFQNSLYTAQIEGLFPGNVQLRLIRGVKNPLSQARSVQNVEVCDFMRGEETQVMGILSHYAPQEAFNVVMFGSHFKIIHVTSDGKIERSMTTMSGQIFDCLIHHTVIGSSVAPGTLSSDGMSLQEIVWLARETMEHRGMMRSFLLPRFMESFTNMTAAERYRYLDAVIALEDLKAIPEYYGDGCYSTKKYFFIGQRKRCELFAEVLRMAGGPCEIEILEKEANRDISIEGALKIINNETGRNCK